MNSEEKAINAMFQSIILKKLREINASIEEVYPGAFSSDDFMKAICRLIAYNENDELQEKSDDIRRRILRGEVPPEVWSRIKEAAEKLYANKSLRAYEREKPKGATIVQLCMGLGVSIDEVNMVLQSYGEQMISYHRADDLLYRYALAKGWSYNRFRRELLKPKLHEEVATTCAESMQELDSHERNSAMLTIQNSNFLQWMLIQQESTVNPYEMFCNLTQDEKWSSNGAVRRVFLRACGTMKQAQHEVPDKEAHNDWVMKEVHHKCTKCMSPHSKCSCIMMNEAAGYSVTVKNDKDDVNAILTVIDSLVRRCHLEALKTDAPAVLYTATVLEREMRKALPTDMHPAGDGIAARFEHIKSFLAKTADEIGAMEKAQWIIWRSQVECINSTLYRLQICAASKKARVEFSAMLWEWLSAFEENQKELVSKKNLSTKLNPLFSFDTKPDIRNSEPSRQLLIWMLLYAPPVYLLYQEQCAARIQEYISEQLQAAMLLPLGTEDNDRAVIDLIQEAASRLPHANFREYHCAWHNTCLMEAYQSMVPNSRKMLCISRLVEGGWNYKTLEGRAPRTKTRKERERDEAR